MSKIHKILFFIDFCDVKPWGLLALIVIIRKNNSFFSCFYEVLIYVDVEMLRTLQNIFDLSIDSLIYLFLFCFTLDICFPYDCYRSVYTHISYLISKRFIIRCEYLQTLIFVGYVLVDCFFAGSCLDCIVLL